ncbi:hypothetical protein J6590_013784, partial [Homalodisca vitripennis]
TIVQHPSDLIYVPLCRRMSLPRIASAQSTCPRGNVHCPLSTIPPQLFLVHHSPGLSDSRSSQVIAPLSLVGA